MSKKQRPLSIVPGKRPRHSMSRFLLEAVLPLFIVMIAGSALLYVQITSHNADAAAQPNPNCTLIVPPNPLSAQGLATAYQLTATLPANGPCNEANVNQSAFVQGAIFDPATGNISLYDPLVIDQGTVVAITPIVPQLPANAIVGLWFGFQGTNLTLQSTNGSLQQGLCVNGEANSVFGEFAYCNAPAFFVAANQAIQNGQLPVLPAGLGNDGLQCVTSRDFGLVDQDQSDNVTTSYLLINNRITQNTAANRAQQAAQQILTNASDNLLLTGFVDKALGCTPMMAPDLADNGALKPSLPLNELQSAAAFANVAANGTMNTSPATNGAAIAAATGNINLINALNGNALSGIPLAQVEPATVAIVPINDPMVLNNNMPNPQKEAMYQIGVDQIPQTVNGATYCMNLGNIGPARIAFDMQFTQNAASPNALAANSLYTFLANRINQAWVALNCPQLLGLSPNKTNTTQQTPRNDFNPFKFNPQQALQQQLPFNVQVQNQIIVQATLNPNFKATRIGQRTKNNGNGGINVNNGNNTNGGTNGNNGNNTNGGTNGNNGNGGINIDTNGSGVINTDINSLSNN